MGGRRSAGVTEAILYMLRRVERGSTSVEAEPLLADEVLLVGGVDEDRLAVLLIVRHVGHVDVQSAARDALRDTIGEQSLERRRRVAHEKRSTRHIRLDDRVWVSGIEEALLGVLDQGSGLSRVYRSKLVSERKRATFGLHTYRLASACWR